MWLLRFSRGYSTHTNFIPESGNDSLHHNKPEKAVISWNEMRNKAVDNEMSWIPIWVDMAKKNVFVSLFVEAL